LGSAQLARELLSLGLHALECGGERANGLLQVVPKA
jgi:hypothetical protein